MHNARNSLIVGAGPVGLAAGLFLAKQGLYPRIIDTAPTASLHSKALAVNPRTLELLESTGVTEKMLNLGLRVKQMHLWNNTELMARVSFEKLPHKYPFILALSQATTERLLAEELQRQGGNVECSWRLNHCRQSADTISAEIENAAIGAKESLTPQWLMAADGARSTVRQELGIDFIGSSLKNQWFLADIGLDTSLAEDSAHVNFFDEGGFLFLVRVVDEQQEKSVSAPLWRVISNIPDILSRLPKAMPVGKPIWESSFHIGHRIAARLQQGNIFLAGDAAHIHSPMGARGMNLGIEDAWSFTELLRNGKLQNYGNLRRPIDKKVVQRVKLLTHMVGGETIISRFLRMHLLPKLISTPFFFKKMSGTLTGLDHPL